MPDFPETLCSRSSPWNHCRMSVKELTPHSNVALCLGLVRMTLAAAERAASAEERGSHP